MKKIMNKIMAMVLALSLIMTMNLSVFAAEGDTAEDASVVGSEELLNDIGSDRLLTEGESNDDNEGENNNETEDLEGENVPATTADLTITNYVKMFKVASAVLETKGTYGEKDYERNLLLTMGSDSFGKVYFGTSEEAEAATEGICDIQDRQVSIPVTASTAEGEIAFDYVGRQKTASFWSVKNKTWYQRDIFINGEKPSITFYNTKKHVSIVDELTQEEAIKRAGELATPEIVDQLIEAIRAQERDANTDKYCAVAKAFWDALSPEDREKVEEGEYFSTETGDASLDDPLNQDEIGEKEILVVSFGTSYNDSRRLTIGGIEKALQKAYPDYSVRRAFTSQIIINRIQARDGIKTDNIYQAMDRAVDNGVREMIIQPTHLMHGTEYDEFKDVVEKYKSDIPKITIAEPLLSSNEDREASAEALLKAAKADAGNVSADTAFVFLGHGTSHEAKENYAQMQEIYEKMGAKNVFVGTVEGEPESTSKEVIVERVKQAGYKKVILRPMMVVAGDHANNDMSDISDSESWISAFRAAGFKLTVKDNCQLTGMGQIADVQKIYVKHTHDIAGCSYERTTTKKATLSSGGEKADRCIICGDVKNQEEFAAIGSVTVSTKGTVYTGKNIRPEIEIKDTEGKLLEKGRDYNVTYPKISKSVGKYKASVAFAGDYGDKTVVSYTVKPVSTKIKSASTKKTSMNVKWTKKSTQVTGYQIRYSKNSSLAGAKAVRVKSYKTTAKRISSLKRATKYYVQIRTYKKTAGGNCYSDWSTVKTVKTK